MTDPQQLSQQQQQQQQQRREQALPVREVNSQEEMMTDEIVATIMSTDPQQPDTLASLASKLVTLTEPQLQSYTSNGLDPLTALDPSAHTLGYLYFLTARCLAVERAEHALFYVQTINHFANVCDPLQLVYAPARVSYIAKSLEHLAKLLNDPSVIIVPLATAIEKIAPDCSTLTSLHAPFAKACLLAKMYRYPLTILDTDIEDVDTAAHDISIKSFLLYHYYGSMIYIGNKNFERAIDFLLLVLSAPAQTVSVIQMEAYKKFILVSLIHYGHIPALPKYTFHPLEKTFEHKHPGYLVIAESFKERSVRHFKKTLDTHSEMLNTDANMGLAKQCLQALGRETIKRLTKVYVTLSLQEMTTMLEPVDDQPVTEDQVERLLLEMIENDQVHAKLSVTGTDHGIKMVHFVEEEYMSDTLDTSLRLESRISDAVSVGKKVSSMDRHEGLSKEFQTKYMNLSMHGDQFITPVAFEEDMEIPLDED